MSGGFQAAIRRPSGTRWTLRRRLKYHSASRKIPAAICELLERNGKAAASIKVFLMHQANQNLINRVARTLEVPPHKFFSNIRLYGNTSSASMLIAASEWWNQNPRPAGASICFAAFGAGFHWGALLAEG